MNPATSSRSAMPRKESAASCRAAIQPSVRSASARTAGGERVHGGGGEPQPHYPVEELLRLQWGEAKIGGAQLIELATTAQPGQRQWRIRAGRHDQMQMIRKVLEQEGDRLVHLGRSDRV